MTKLDHEYKFTPLNKPVRITDHYWPEGTVPLVSITCITYNHVNFTRDAIESFLMQETVFPVEILIHDDASTDGTSEIVRDYETRYPQLIKVIYQSENQYSKGIKAGEFLQSLQRGKYIAICEGDDYWLASFKLEKQVNFLERNPGVSFCFHNAVIIDERTGKARLFSDCAIDSWHVLEDLIQSNFIPTASKVVRKSALQKVDIPDEVKAEDWVEHFTAAEQGKYYYFRDVMSVYRLHGAGLWTSMNGIDKLNGEIKVLEFLKKIAKAENSEKIQKSINRRINSSSFTQRLKSKALGVCNCFRHIWVNIMKCIIN